MKLRFEPTILLQHGRSRRQVGRSREIEPQSGDVNQPKNWFSSFFLLLLAMLMLLIPRKKTESSFFVRSLPGNSVKVWCCFIGFNTLIVTELFRARRWVERKICFLFHVNINNFSYARRLRHHHIARASSRTLIARGWKLSKAKQKILSESKSKRAAWTRNFTLVGKKKRATVEQEKEELKSKMK